MSGGVDYRCFRAFVIALQVGHRRRGDAGGERQLACLKTKHGQRKTVSIHDKCCTSAQVVDDSLDYLGRLVAVSFWPRRAVEHRDGEVVRPGVASGWAVEELVPENRAQIALVAVESMR